MKSIFSQIKNRGRLFIQHIFHYMFFFVATEHVSLANKFFFVLFFSNFCWTKAHFVEPLIAPVLDFVCPSSWVSNPEWIFRLHSFLLAVIPKVTSGETPAFSTKRGVHCISLYTAWLAGLLSHTLGFEPPTQWSAAQWCETKV